MHSVECAFLMSRILRNVYLHYGNFLHSEFCGQRKVKYDVYLCSVKNKDHFAITIFNKYTARDTKDTDTGTDMVII